MKRLLSLLVVLALFFAITAAGESKKNGSDGDVGKNSKTEKPKEINWMSYDEGLKLARESGKHIFVNFTTKWCGYCKKMNVTTFAEPEVVEMLSDHFISIKVDGDSKNELDINGYKITERDLSVAEFRVRGYPTYWLLKPDGEKLGYVSGYQQSGNFLDMLFFMKESLYDKMKFEDYMKNGGRKAYSKG